MPITARVAAKPRSFPATALPANSVRRVDYYKRRQKKGGKGIMVLAVVAFVVVLLREAIFPMPAPGRIDRIDEHEKSLDTTAITGASVQINVQPSSKISKGRGRQKTTKDLGSSDHGAGYDGRNPLVEKDPSTPEPSGKGSQALYSPRTAEDGAAGELPTTTTATEGWLSLGSELFYFTSPAAVGNATSATPLPSSARRECEMLDTAARESGPSKDAIPHAFTRCMDALEDAQASFRRTYPAVDEPCDDSDGRPKPKLLIHAMWKGPLTPVARLGILSFVLSHPGGCVRVILWTASKSDRIALETQLRPHLEGGRDEALVVKVINLTELMSSIAHTHPKLTDKLHTARPALERATGGTWTGRNNRKDLASLSDLVRVLVLAAYGGLYLDADMLVLRSILPLTGRDFYYRWSYRNYANTAAMHVRKGSTNGAGLVEIALDALEKSAGSERKLAKLLHPSSLSREVQGRDMDIELLPSAYFDPLWIVYDMFEYGKVKGSGDDGDGNGPTFALDRYGIRYHTDFLGTLNVNANVRNDPRNKFFPGAFVFHWHNQWKDDIVVGSTADLFVSAFDRIGGAEGRTAAPPPSGIAPLAG